MGGRSVTATANDDYDDDNSERTNDIHYIFTTKMHT